MALTVTPEVFVDLLLLSLSWEWDKGEERFRASIGTERILHHAVTAYTTVDKVVRILNGLDILTDKQRKFLFRDRRTQSLVLRRSEVLSPGFDVLGVYANSSKQMILVCDMVSEFNRQKMLRNMRFYITAKGKNRADEVSARYSAYISSESYFAEIIKQDEKFNGDSAARASVMARYQRKVEEETKR